MKNPKHLLLVFLQLECVEGSQIKQKLKKRPLRLMAKMEIASIKNKDLAYSLWWQTNKVIKVKVSF